MSQQFTEAVGRTPCPLLALPAELRIRIYEACLAPSGTIYLPSNAGISVFNAGVSTALLATCHQIHAEAQDCLFQSNTICFFADACRMQEPIIASS
jgi:hypothetical protein